MDNPYEPPAALTETVALDWFPMAISVFTSRYLYVIAALGVLSMLLGFVGIGENRVDLSFLFVIWAGRGLAARSNTARKWVIGFCAFAVVAMVASAVVTLIRGTEGITVRLLWRFENPSIQIALLAVGFMIILFAIPLGMLLSAQARNEFTNPAPSG